MSTRPSSLLRLAEWLIAALLRTYPRAFQQAFGRELREMFCDEARERLDTGGRAGLLRFCGQTVAGMAAGTALEHLHARRDRLPDFRGNARGDHPMKTFLQDLRYCLRSLAHRPGFTAAVLVTLALGIGANTALFSIVNAVLLQSLPYAQPERLVRVWGENRTWKSERDRVNPLDVHDWRAQNHVFSDIAAYSYNGRTLLLSGDSSEVVNSAVTTPSLFRLLGVSPAAGRSFHDEEQTPGKHRVVMLSYGFWRRRFGADPAVVGTQVSMFGTPYTVVGVLPQTFNYPDSSRPAEPDIWRPLQYNPESQGRGGHFLLAVARLKAGASLPQAQAEMDAITAGLERLYPVTNTGQAVRIEPLQEAIVRDARKALLVLFGAVAFVLLIACANVANLLLARGAGRQREIAIRTALGASRRRMLSLLVTESLLLALAGGALALLIAFWAVPALLALAPPELPRVRAVALDGRVLGFTLALSLVASAVCGLLPAWQLSGTRLQGALKDGTPSTTRGAGQGRVRQLLIVAQVGVSLVLVVGAGLLIRSLVRLQQVDPGFATVHVVTGDVYIPGASYDIVEFFRQLEDRLGTIPGVQAVGSSNMLPLTRSNSCDSFGLGDRPAPPDGQEPCAEARIITPGYFGAMGIPLIKGRAFTSRDSAEAPPVVIVNAAMAREYWPSVDPVGQRFKWGSVTTAGPWATVVGVVGDLRHFGLGEDIVPEVYSPLEQRPISDLAVVVRTSGDTASVVPAMRAALRQLEPGAAFNQMQTTADLVAASVAQPRFRALLLSLFAGLAMLLAALGIYAVMSCVVAERTSEMGLRMALGASRGSVLRIVLGQAMTTTIAGIGIGIVGAIATSRVLQSLLFGVEPTDLLTLGAGTGLLLVAALAACLVPAARATRVDPIVALRAE